MNWTTTLIIACSALSLACGSVDELSTQSQAQGLEKEAIGKYFAFELDGVEPAYEQTTDEGREDEPEPVVEPEPTGKEPVAKPPEEERRKPVCEDKELAVELGGRDSMIWLIWDGETLEVSAPSAGADRIEATAGGAPFPFDQARDTGIQMDVEGLHVSQSVGDIVGEFTISNAVGSVTCEWRVTVVDLEVDVDIRRGRGSSFDNHAKMLAGGEGQLTATLRPADADSEVEWRYEGDLEFETPEELETAIRAGGEHTSEGARDEEVEVEVTVLGLTLTRSFPLNITAPLGVAFRDRPSFEDVARVFVNGDRFRFFRDRSWTGTVVDQFGEPIKESAFARRTLETRTNLNEVLASPLPGLDFAPDDWDLLDRDGKGELRARGEVLSIRLLLEDPAAAYRRFHSAILMAETIIGVTDGGSIDIEFRTDSGLFWAVETGGDFSCERGQIDAPPGNAYYNPQWAELHSVLSIPRLIGSAR